jgi:hypothetical protein
VTFEIGQDRCLRCVRDTSLKIRDDLGELLGVASDPQQEFDILSWVGLLHDRATGPVKQDMLLLYGTFESFDEDHTLL